jgi:sugar phosphate isomerase/epimerase
MPMAIGVTTSSFRDLPRLTGRGNVDAVLQAARSAGATHLELALLNIEPAPPSTAPVMGGSAAYPKRIVLTPEEIAATDSASRDALRTWRLGAGAEVFDEARRRAASAGLRLDACAVTFNDSFTDEEIDATFRHVTALGVKTVSSPLTPAMARRLVPFAERHAVSIAIHNQVDGNPGGLIDTAHLAEALALSPLYRLRLDVGNLTASNRDAVAVVREHLPRAAAVILKDRLRNGGASQPLGEGDTPLAGVLTVLGAARPPVPMLLEYDYAGLRGSVGEVKTSLAYLAGLLPRVD